MSLLIGKDLVDDPIMHITRTVKSATELKSGIIDGDTVFHSDLPYVSHTPITSISATAGNVGSILFGWVQGVDGVFYTFPTSMLSIPALNKLLILPTLNNKTLAEFIGEDNTGGGYNVSELLWYATTAGGDDNNNSYYPTTIYKYLFVPLSSPSILCKLLITNIRVDSGWITPTYDSSGITINNSDITIMGNSIAQFKYLSNTSINAIDDDILTNSGYIQAVNSVNSTGNMKLSSDSSEISISIDNKRLFYSNVPVGKIFYNQKFTNDITLNDTGTAIAHNLAVGDMFVLENGYNINGATTSIYKFTTGIIGTVAWFFSVLAGVYNKVEIYENGSSLYIRTVGIGGQSASTVTNYKVNIHTFK